MAKEWYLATSPYGQFDEEGEGTYLDYAQASFNAVAESYVGEHVTLYNYDLSQPTELDIVMTNRVQDTKLNALTRLMLAPMYSSVVAGIYVKYKGRYWIITNVVDDNGVYRKCVLALCNDLLTWINKDGEIVQRWANVTSASQYNNGETSVSYESYHIRSDQLMVILPDDKESLLLDSGKRFIVDRRCSIYEEEFGEDVTEDTSNSLFVYEITRSNTILYDYSDSGHAEIMLTQCEQEPQDGYYVVNGKGYWLCEAPATSSTTDSEPTSKIEYDDASIYAGMGSTVFSAKFYDSDGNEDDTVSPIWTIDCDFLDSLVVVYNENTIEISTDNKKLINQSFTLLLDADGYTQASAVITIKSFF